MINKVILVGRLTRDPEVHETADGRKVVNLRLVTTEYAGGDRREEVQYHSLVAFGRLAEICADYLRKGRLVYFEGKLHTREWDGKDGLHRYTTEIHLSELKMLSPAPVAGVTGSEYEISGPDEERDITCQRCGDEATEARYNRSRWVDCLNCGSYDLEDLDDGSDPARTRGLVIKDGLHRYTTEIHLSEMKMLSPYPLEDTDANPV